MMQKRSRKNRLGRGLLIMLLATSGLLGCSTKHNPAYRTEGEEEGETEGEGEGLEGEGEGVEFEGLEGEGEGLEGEGEGLEGEGEGTEGEGEGAPECTVDMLRTCTCPNGSEGVRHCMAGRWGPCECDEPEGQEGEGEGTEGEGEGTEGEGEGTEGEGEGTEGEGEGTEGEGEGLEGEGEGHDPRCPPEVEEPSEEVCDLLDNDCDGTTDEELGQVMCGVGECRRWVHFCEDGEEQQCRPGTPRDEQCNLLDDDCDGQIDEDGVCQCVRGTTQPCGSAVGECRQGEQLCADGFWSECAGGQGPVPELCNGRDDNCDGQIDDGFGEQSCGQGQCRRTVPSCRDGQPVACVPGPPAAEVCDRLDNDCDGATDEELGTLSCGQGVCSRTVAACVNGQPQQCVAGNPGQERCDGLDNDCDGATDEGFAATTCGVGECRRTIEGCVNGVPQVCEPLPARAEVCDELDNDCDGRTDEERVCWSYETVDLEQPPMTGTVLDLTMGRDGRPWLLFPVKDADGSSWQVLGVRRPRNQGWTIWEPANGNGYPGALAVDSAGTVHVAWAGLYYTRVTTNGGDRLQQTERVDANNAVGQSGAVALAATGVNQVAIIYGAAGNDGNDLRLATGSPGNFAIRNQETIGTTGYRVAALATATGPVYAYLESLLDASGDITGFRTWFLDQNRTKSFVTESPEWEPLTLVQDPAGVISLVAPGPVDPADDDIVQDLLLRRSADGAFQTVGALPDGAEPRLALTRDGTPIVCTSNWVNNNRLGIRLAWPDGGGGWYQESVDNTGAFCDLAVDDQGRIHLAFKDGETGRVRYAVRDRLPVGDVGGGPDPVVVPLVNDQCRNAIEIPAEYGEYHYEGTTVGAAADYLPPAGYNQNPDVWYRLRHEGDFPLYGSFTLTGTPRWDTMLYLLTGSCDNLTYRTSDDDQYQDQVTPSFIERELPVGSTYYLVVSGYDGNDAGPFVLDVLLEE